ncbi:uncharacterized protein LOC103312900 isoform X1 [Tribolium castaneum]|uniref:uncharacterized protein LOC103312900 isoform X1 n=1 Tax=Tribolium castaneum TaxID=7070 RepID=UPI0030FF32CD
MCEMKLIVVITCLIPEILGHHINFEETECPARYKLDETVFSNQKFFQKLVEDIKFNNNRTVTNDYVDEIFFNIRNLMIHEDFDPIQLPGVSTNLSNTFIVTYQGILNLSQGWLSDLSTIHRKGEIISYNYHNKYFMTIPVAFKEMHFTYDYDTTIMGLKSQGGIEGKISYLSAKVKIGFDSQKLVTFLEDFHIDNSGIAQYAIADEFLVSSATNSQDVQNEFNGSAIRFIKALLKDHFEIIAKTTIGVISILIGAKILHYHFKTMDQRNNPVYPRDFSKFSIRQFCSHC